MATFRVPSRWVVVAAAVVLGAGLSLAAQSAGQGSVAGPALTQPIPVDPQVTIGVFPNGLHYYLRANKQPLNRVELRLAVNAGSILEDDDQRGLAHLVEHMSFDGTTHFPQKEM